jgi:hypothetical protein
MQKHTCLEENPMYNRYFDCILYNEQAFFGGDATTWKYIRRISMFRAKALRLDLLAMQTKGQIILLSWK